MRILQIKTTDELKLALVRADELWETKDVKELDGLDALATLLSDYEDKMLFEERKNQSEIEVKINDL
jgi:hypothetical protein